MTLFGDHAENDLKRAVGLVEQTIEALGVNPAETRIGASDGSHRWSLRRGSAAILVAVLPPSEAAPAGSLRVVAPVVRVPPEDRMLPLARRLLEANARELRGVAFGLREEDVVLISERSLQDLDASEVSSVVRAIGSAADRYDDLLAQEFGTSRSSD